MSLWHEYIYDNAPLAQMESSKKYGPITCILILNILYQVFPKQDGCISKSLQVTQKVPEWSETEAPSDGFIVINVNIDFYRPLSCDHWNSSFVYVNKSSEWDLNPTQGLSWDSRYKQ